jgi:hypothetical protein
MKIAEGREFEPPRSHDPASKQASRPAISISIVALLPCTMLLIP